MNPISVKTVLETEFCDDKGAAESGIYAAIDDGDENDIVNTKENHATGVKTCELGQDVMM